MLSVCFSLALRLLSARFWLALRQLMLSVGLVVSGCSATVQGVLSRQSTCSPRRTVLHCWIAASAPRPSAAARCRSPFSFPRKGLLRTQSHTSLPFFQCLFNTCLLAISIRTSMLAKHGIAVKRRRESGTHILALFDRASPSGGSTWGQKKKSQN